MKIITFLCVIGFVGCATAQVQSTVPSCPKWSARALDDLGHLLELQKEQRLVLPEIGKYEKRKDIRGLENIIGRQEVQCDALSPWLE